MTRFIANHSLTFGDPEWPKLTPSCFLSLELIKQAFKACRLNLDTGIVLISNEAFKRIHEHEEFTRLKNIIVENDWGVGRADFVNGEWCPRVFGTPEYANAVYEDAMIGCLPTSTMVAILRYHRVLSSFDMTACP